MNDQENPDDERTSEDRVSGYLECIDQQRSRARRNRLIALAVGLATAGVAMLTPAETRNLVASAGAIAASVALGRG